MRIFNLNEKFQVHLQGLIDLLSNHLYSGPEVFIRELLQNAQDAITARQQSERDVEGLVRIEVIHAPGQMPTMSITDNGIGLTESEVHRFLATIGESSKRLQNGGGPTDFIGRFGVGLLSCFMVSEEIIVVTRSIQGGETVSWRGRPDGTYSVTKSDLEIDVGTRVYLTCRSGQESLMKRETVLKLCRFYGGMLPHRIEICDGEHFELANINSVPWHMKTNDSQEISQRYLSFGEEIFEQTHLDVIPLTAKAGLVRGAAYVLSHSASLVHRPRNRVYIKGMLITDKDESILPPWALFTQAVINAEALSPTASRDAIYEDESLENCRVELGVCIRKYLINLAKNRPEKLANLVRVHLSALRALAVEDDECFETLISLLPFETTDGTLTIPEFLARHSALLYVESVDQFRQIAPVATAQGIGVINAGYVHTAELLARYGYLHDDADVGPIDTERFAQSLEDLTENEEKQSHLLSHIASKTLRPYRCKTELRNFSPIELPALYTLDHAGQIMRSMEQSREVSNSLYSDVLGSLMKQTSIPYVSQLLLNYRNPLVRKLATLQNEKIIATSIRMFYVQAMLLAHQPLKSDEMRLLTSGMQELIQATVDLSTFNP